MKNFEKGKLIGEGGEQKVYEDKLHANRVVKVGKEDALKHWTGYEVSAEYQKASHYLAKILHILFPENFPNVIEMDVRDGTLVQDRVELDKEHIAGIKHSKEYSEFFNAMRKKYKPLGRLDDAKLTADEREKLNNLMEKEEEIYERFTKLKKPFLNKLKEAGVGMDVMDDGDLNYTESKSGELMYLDNVEPWLNRTSKKMYVSPEKLQNKIDELAEPEKARATQYLKRMLELFEQEKKNNINTNYE